MLLHPVRIMLSFTLILTLLFTASTNSYFMMWVGMEANLICFIPLTVKKSKNSMEATIKYFLIQSLASFMILGGSILLPMPLNLSGLAFISVGLFVKAGFAPFHRWVPAVAHQLDWPILYLMLTAQKLIPLFGLLTLFQSLPDMGNPFKIYAGVSLVFGAFGGIIHQNLKKIIAFSSVSHMGWTLAAAFSSKLFMMMYFTGYSLMVLSVVTACAASQSSSLTDLQFNTKQSTTSLIMLSLLSLAGLPPFSGFLLKFMVMSELMLREEYDDSPMFIIMLVTPAVSLYFYLRVAFKTLLTSPDINGPLRQTRHLSSELMLLNLMFLMAPSIFYCGFMFI